MIMLPRFLEKKTCRFVGDDARQTALQVSLVAVFPLISSNG